MSEHIYVSTACQHDLHDRCRLRCKFCDKPCMCGCHHRPEWASPDEWIKCDYCSERHDNEVWHSSEAGHPTEKNEKGQWVTPISTSDRVSDE